MLNADAHAKFNALLEEIGAGVPNAEQYQQMSTLILDFPEARTLAGMDPFQPSYKAAAMTLYLSLRGRAEQGYDARRDEASAGSLPQNLWTGLVPWSFQDAGMVSEHLLAWGHILAHLNLPPGGSLLEYGPGSGQLLLIVARTGYRACGVDIDEVALDGIRAQATHLGLPVETQRAEFGQGFEGEAFDTILFYEAFHHAFEFEQLLRTLHHRVKPAGRIVLCGEPVVSKQTEGIPYPWGPRLDGLSVFCMRRFGWMELGFTHDFLMEITRRTGWTTSFHPFPNSGRAAVYVLRKTAQDSIAAPTATARQMRLRRAANFALQTPALRPFAIPAISTLRKLKNRLH
ncbi:MAG TPA: class I SAM-dependent methyltransferase [Acidobacteriaceae bacterium]|nr:class I SAM-dependent methyltransferase [Acidobacteriaceae bacterium]